MKDIITELNSASKYILMSINGLYIYIHVYKTNIVTTFFNPPTNKFLQFYFLIF